MPTDTSVPPNGAAPRPLTVAYVPGVTPGKWITRWEERRLAELRSYQCEEDAVLAELSSGRADLGFLRFPAEGYVRPGGLNLIPLYEEQPVAVAAKEHPLAAFEELGLADLEGETLLDVAGMGGPAMALEVAAAGSGVVILPMSVVRLHSRRDTVARPVHGVPATRIGVAWLPERDGGDVEEFIGVVRGRTANSSRQPSVLEEQKTTARQRTKARQSRSGPAAKTGSSSGAAGSKAKSSTKGGAKGGTKGGPKGGKPRRSR